MDKVIRAADTPFSVNVESGKTYTWCACGRSSKQPFCDGSHAGTGIKPVSYEASKNEVVYFCGCKQTKSAPMCDGSHANK
ncbi:MAG TPA: CDGSH iron-sulfur domain-containing protein [Chromatiales bacterium]|jgi:CDGSH-type Zn-finger protein|nr:CDGSH iron-sulfur domain-containing protein [Chromatiaceae bacterium]HIB84169.1 CDGSH iron-sulfur domain-containing protein [Chromatiaceae bacterium]HIN82499.1 CDGSH iron-sulfur domain-containing protein [Chromatiales bacterium]HIO14938.1 CDGSH iron-sulfur domain-containing protein [Chromatiales bacterium]HIO54526.1 CDGSH iron-sulfur domain-containing protein [Chromatiales bacterium]